MVLLLFICRVNLQNGHHHTIGMHHRNPTKYTIQHQEGALTGGVVGVACIEWVANQEITVKLCQYKQPMNV